VAEKLQTPNNNPKRPRRPPEIPTASVKLDEREKALQSLLPQVLVDFEFETVLAVDEVIISIKPQDLPAICKVVKDDDDLNLGYLRCISVVDYIEYLEAVYHLFSLKKRHKLVIKVQLPTESPHLPSVVSIWRGADWFEREGHDLFGVVFDGHPNLVPLVLYEGFNGNPGLKSFPFHDYKEW